MALKSTHAFDRSSRRQYLILAPQLLILLAAILRPIMSLHYARPFIPILHLRAAMTLPSQVTRYAASSRAGRLRIINAASIARLCPAGGIRRRVAGTHGFHALMRAANTPERSFFQLGNAVGGTERLCASRSRSIFGDRFEGFRKLLVGGRK